MDVIAVRKFCAETFLVPFESYATALHDGSCESYPDPGSAMYKAGYRKWQNGTKFVPDDGAPWTIGYGSTFDESGKPIVPGEIWSHDRAILVKGIVTNKFLKQLTMLSPNLINEPIPRVAAVLSWVYNCGIGSYRVSTFKKRIDLSDWQGAAEECLKWDKAKGVKLKGLTRRRLLESRYIENA